MKVAPVAIGAFSLTLAGALTALGVLPQQSGTVDLLSAANIEIGGGAQERAGVSVAGAGDVNGDGRRDVIVGAREAGYNGIASGSAYVVFGGGTSASVDMTAAFLGFRIDGQAGGHRAGYSVAGAGDVNGDGRDDVIVGAPFTANAGIDSGSAYVVFGKPGPEPVALLSLALEGSGFRIDGPGANGRAGASVAGVPDMNGDGRAEVVVGAPGVTSLAGAAYLVFGKAGTDTVSLSALGPSGYAMTGPAASASAGTAVAAAGDMNGDGRGDVVVGAPGANAGSGSAFVVFGKPNTAAVPLGGLGASGFRIDGQAANHVAGTSVAGAGDMDGDGRVDVIVTAPGAGNNGRADSGSAYVVYGKTDPAAVSLAALGASGFRIDGQLPGHRIGTSVAGVGDVNGDGRPDVGVGASQVGNNGRSNSGSGYVVFGKSGDAPVDLASLGSAGFRIDGQGQDDQVGSGIAGPGDVNGDGRPDVVIGAWQADFSNRALSGAAYVVFGFGSPQLAYAPLTGTAGTPLAAHGPSTLARTGLASFQMGPALPAGLTLNAATGVITGTPQAALATTTFTVTMNDLAGSTTAPLSLSVAAAATPPPPPTPLTPQPACSTLKGVARARCLARARCTRLKGALRARCLARAACTGRTPVRAKRLCVARAGCVARPAAKKRACLVRADRLYGPKKKPR